MNKDIITIKTSEATERNTVTLIPTWDAAANIYIMGLQSNPDNQGSIKGIREMAGHLDDLNKEARQEREENGGYSNRETYLVASYMNDFLTDWQEVAFTCKFNVDRLTDAIESDWVHRGSTQGEGAFITLLAYSLGQVDFKAIAKRVLETMEAN